VLIISDKADYVMANFSAVPKQQFVLIIDTMNNDREINELNMEHYLGLYNNNIIIIYKHFIYSELCSLHCLPFVEHSLP
jgi:hypothetical protein